jgi:TonB family protein
MNNAFHQFPEGPQQNCSPASEASRALDFPNVAAGIFPESLQEKAPVRPKAPPKPKFVDVTELDAKPTPQVPPQLTYTQQAIDEQIRGTVVLEVSIDETGHVTDTSVVQGPSPDYGMDQVCLDAAKSMVYSVPTWKGLPAKTRLLLPIVLDPPPKPKPAPAQNMTSLGVIVEAKASLGKFQLLIDQRVVWESALIGPLGETKRATKELRFPAGTHQIEFLAWMPNGTKPFGTSGTYTGETGKHHVVKYYVTIFGNIKGGMVQ